MTDPKLHISNDFEYDVEMWDEIKREWDRELFDELEEDEIEEEEEDIDDEESI